MIDHLVYTVPDLEQGCRELERLLGSAPAPGGRHPEFGTHNALLSLGPESYLEILAADPETEPPPAGPIFGMARRPQSRLATWALAADSPAALAEMGAAAAAAGVDLGAVGEGSRRAPGGAVLRWRLTDPRADRLDGVVPFLIAWGETPHPAATAPRAGRLVKLRCEHPDPHRVRGALAALGALREEVEVAPGPEPRLTATLENDAGRVELA